MERQKRKRDEDGDTLVTFYAPDRAFSRVYKGTFSHSLHRSGTLVLSGSRSPVGQSLDETKRLVRQKLSLGDDASIRFARLHEGKVIELDDGEHLQPHYFLVT